MAKGAGGAVVVADVPGREESAAQTSAQLEAVVRAREEQERGAPLADLGARGLA